MGVGDRLGEIISGRDIVLQFDPDRVRKAASMFPEIAELGPFLTAALRRLAFFGEMRRCGAGLLEAMGQVGGFERLTLFSAPADPVEGGVAHSVRVNAVNPVVTLTPMAEEAWSDPAKSGPMLARIPIGRFVQPSEVSSVIAYLLSSDAAMINGVSMPVDGGFMIS